MIDVLKPRDGRRLSRWVSTAGVLALSTLTLTVGSARAATDDPCQDLRNQQRVHEDLAAGWWGLAQTMQNLGLTALYREYRAEANLEVAKARVADNSLKYHNC
jgi:hypothetical protein